MKKGTAEEKRELADNPEISEGQQHQLLEAAEDQEYYFENFRFDILDKHYMDPQETVFYYEENFPLLQDPELYAAGVTISARVTFREGNSVNHIVFKKGGVERIVSCVHTAVCNLPPEMLERKMAELEENPGEMVIPVEDQPIKLTPEGHFVALKSYVAGIAETGIANMMEVSYHSERFNPETLPFGFNSAMQKQICTQLRDLAADATRTLITNHITLLFDELPLDWSRSRLKLLDDIYGLRELLLENFEVFDLIYSRNRLHNLEEWALEYRPTHPSILPYIASGGRVREWSPLFTSTQSLPDAAGDNLQGRRWEIVATFVRNYDLNLKVRHFFLSHAQWFVEQDPNDEGSELGQKCAEILCETDIPSPYSDRLFALMSLELKSVVKNAVRACSRRPVWGLKILITSSDEDEQFLALLDPLMPSEPGKKLIRGVTKRVKLGIFSRPNYPQWF